MENQQEQTMINPNVEHTIKSTPTKQPTINMDDYISKKIASIEVLKEIKTSKRVVFTSIAGIFVSYLISVLDQIVAGIVLTIFVVLLALVLKKSLDKEKILKTKYNISE